MNCKKALCFIIMFLCINIGNCYAEWQLSGNTITNTVSGTNPVNVTYDADYTTFYSDGSFGYLGANSLSLSAPAVRGAWIVDVDTINGDLGFSLDKQRISSITYQVTGNDETVANCDFEVADYSTNSWIDTGKSIVNDETQEYIISSNIDNYIAASDNPNWDYVVNGGAVRTIRAGEIGFGGNCPPAALAKIQNFKISITLDYTPVTLTVNSTGTTGVAISSTTGHGGTTSYSKTGIVPGANVNLTAPATSGSYSFSSWSGCTSTSGTICTVSMNSDKTVTANYAATTRTIGLSGNLSFGGVVTGKSATRTLSISNTGNSTLTVSGITYPTGFSGNWNGTIPAGESHDVAVTFTPSASNIFGGTITITSNKTDGSDTANCSGSGILGGGYLQVVAGGYHTIALKTDGSLWAWGSNGDGQVGDGTTANKYTPVQVGTDCDWAQVTAGDRHSIALKTDGSLWAWGYNSDGQIGDASTVSKSTPVRIGTDSDWAQVTAGYGHTVALKTDGSLWAWGCNYNGQVGDGTRVNKNTPVQIGTDSDWAQVTAGDLHTIALKKDGSLWAWGDNWDYQLGDGTMTGRYTPVRIGTDCDWSQVAAGNFHTIALKSGGSLWAWGNNTTGQLGDGTTGDKNTPVRIGNNSDWAHVMAGGHTVAQKTNGSLWAWGYNRYGQLGDGTTTDKSSPVQVGTDNNWAQITAGAFFTVAIKTDGSLWAWGRNRFGQLGDGTTANKSTPTLISKKIIELFGSLAFGSVTVGQSKTATLSIKNNGTSTLTVPSISYPSGFSGNWSGTIAAGSSHDVTVTFSPSSATSFGGTITVNSDKSIGIDTINCSGTGLAPPTRIIGLSGSLTFGNVIVGQSSTGTLTINNTGNSTLTVPSISYPSGFSGNWSGAIAAGGSYDVTVTFSPSTATSFGGTITVNSDKTDGFNTISCSGTGANPETLSASLAGTGGGSINSITPEAPFACTSGACAESFPSGTTLTLTATPDVNSLFSGWSGDCSGSGDCNLTMTGPRNVTATFTQSPNVQVTGGGNYDTLASAYAVVVNDGTIKARYMDFIENLILGREIRTTLEGGYDASFTANSGYTTLLGTLTVRTGAVVIDRLVIK